MHFLALSSFSSMRLDFDSWRKVIDLIFKYLKDKLVLLAFVQAAALQLV